MSFRDFLKPRRNTDWEVASLYFGSSKLTVQEISRKTGVSVAEIYRILERSGSKPNRQITNHHNVRLFSHLPVPQIAELTGYTPRNVRYILSKNK